ncbi:hypothetical protein AVEN_231901-1, partial [Araneus ventricosus]
VLKHNQLLSEDGEEDLNVGKPEMQKPIVEIEDLAGLEESLLHNKLYLDHQLF